MMRAFFIAALTLSLGYCVSVFFIAAAADEARDRAFVEMLQSYDETSDAYHTSDLYEEEARSSTKTGGILSLVFMVISSSVFILALMKIKTKSMKIISIIGLSIAGLFLCWAVLPATSPGQVSFDEVGPAFGAAGIALFGLNVAGLIQAFRYKV